MTFHSNICTVVPTKTRDPKIVVYREDKLYRLVVSGYLVREYIQDGSMVPFSPLYINTKMNLKMHKKLIYKIQKWERMK